MIIVSSTIPHITTQPMLLPCRRQTYTLSILSLSPSTQQSQQQTGRHQTRIHSRCFTCTKAPVLLPFPTITICFLSQEKDDNVLPQCHFLFVTCWHIYYVSFIFRYSLGRTRYINNLLILNSWRHHSFWVCLRVFFSITLTDYNRYCFTFFNLFTVPYWFSPVFCQQY